MTEDRYQWLEGQACNLDRMPPTASERIRAAREAQHGGHIICSRCGEPIPDTTVAYMWMHDDFADHGDHYASWESTPANFAAARRIAQGH